MGKKSNYGSTGRRVFILHASSLLASGMQMMLQEQGLEAIEADVRGEDGAHFLNTLGVGDLVIIDSNDPGVRPYFSALQALVQSSDVVVLCLNPGESTMEIYRKEKRSLGRLGDLFDFIRSA